VRILGEAAYKAAVLAFIVEDPPVSTLDVGTKLDLEGIAVRTGHHCCQPVMDRFGISGTVRASFAMYNTIAEIDYFAAALEGIVTEAAARAKPVPLPLAGPEPAFPKAAVGSVAEAADELADLFEFLEDWNARYHQIVEMGGKIPALPVAFKTEANREH